MRGRLFKKKRMKKIILTLILCLLHVSLAQEVTLRLGYFLSPQAALPENFIEPWAQKVMEESNGRIAIETFPNSQLAAAPATYDAIKDGIMDIGWSLPGYTPGRFPISEVFELPFIASNAETTSQAAWDFYDAHLREEFSDVHMIVFHVHAPGLLHIRGEPVTDLASLAGRTIRAPTRSMNAALELVGAQPVGMPVPQVPEAISRGVIDGAALPFEVTTSLKLAELVDSHSGFEGDRAMYTATFFFAMNKDVYEGLPDSLKTVIDNNSGLETSKWAGQVMDAGDAPGLAAAKEAGNEVYTFSEAEREEWLAATQPVTDDWLELMNGAGLDGRALLQEVKDSILEYESR